MAIQVEVHLVCDYCATTDQGVQRATRTRRWSLDGNGYEVEVCDKHSDALDKALDTWQRASRKAGTKPHEISRAKKAAAVAIRRPKKQPEAYDKNEYILWARSKGYNVNPEKRPSGPLVRKFLDERAAKTA